MDPFQRRLVLRAQDGDREAAAQLIEGDLRVPIREISREFNIRGYDQCDKEQEARIVALKAIASYDESKGASLEHWTRKLVRQKFIDLFRKAARKGGAGDLSLDLEDGDGGSLEETLSDEQILEAFENPDVAGREEQNFLRCWFVLCSAIKGQPVPGTEALVEAYADLSRRWMRPEAYMVIRDTLDDRMDAPLLFRMGPQRDGTVVRRLFCRSFLVFVKAAKVALVCEAQGFLADETDAILRNLLGTDCAGVSRSLIKALAVVWAGDGEVVQDPFGEEG